MKTFKVTLVIKLENGKDVQFIAPSIEDGIEFSKREGIKSIEIEEQIETEKEKTC